MLTFEVGSNLYNLKIRNQISSYSGLTNLSGKFYLVLQMVLY
jgi:hypothetical protein